VLLIDASSSDDVETSSSLLDEVVLLVESCLSSLDVSSSDVE